MGLRGSRENRPLVGRAGDRTPERDTLRELQPDRRTRARTRAPRDSRPRTRAS
jgi:hypothetical protein